VLKTVASCPDHLVVGIDANAASMVDASRRAGRSPKRGGLPNALFVVSVAESLPSELDEFADAVTVHFPWGSLLRGLLVAESDMLSSIARVMQRGAALSVLLSVTEHDRITGFDGFDEQTIAVLAPAYAANGLRLEECHPATAEEIARSHSSWAKRLDAGHSRLVWRLQFRRCELPGE
jgi:16S rRNA (adenine(1408)-N(1))-methyltransferase